MRVLVMVATHNNDNIISNYCVITMPRMTITLNIHECVSPGAAADVLIGSRTTETCGSTPPLARSFLRFSVSAVRVLYTHRIHMYGIYGIMPPHLLYIYIIFMRLCCSFGPSGILFSSLTTGPHHVSGALTRACATKTTTVYTTTDAATIHTHTRTHIYYIR